jgi:hypothetical protein
VGITKGTKMILSTYEEENRTANVCKQAGEYVIMLYEDGNYLRSEVALSEGSAEVVAEDWVLKA